MKRFTLQFNDERDLRRFCSIVSGSYVEIILADLILTCECGEAEIELAERGFNAKIIRIETSPS